MNLKYKFSYSQLESLANEIVDEVNDMLIRAGYSQYFEPEDLQQLIDFFNDDYDCDDCPDEHTEGAIFDEAIDAARYVLEGAGMDKKDDVKYALDVIGVLESIEKMLYEANTNTDFLYEGASVDYFAKQFLHDMQQDVDKEESFSWLHDIPEHCLSLVATRRASDYLSALSMIGDYYIL